MTLCHPHNKENVSVNMVLLVWDKPAVPSVQSIAVMSCIACCRYITYSEESAGEGGMLCNLQIP